jgi:L-fucose isomerase-like protein
MYEQVKLGLVPIGKVLFSHEDAKRYKKLIEQKLDSMGIRYVGIDSVLADGIIRSYDDVEPAVRFLKSQGVDCIFMPHCNFGTESATGLIGQKLGVPVLLWGPQDKAPLADGTRLRDSFCGMLASSKVLNKLNVPFTYIENCELDDETFAQGMDKFLRAANVVKRLHGAKLGMIGNRIDFFWSTIVDENDLLQKFGIEVLPMDLIRFTQMVKENAHVRKASYEAELAEFKRNFTIIGMADESVINVLSARDVMHRWATENNLSALAVESFMAVINELNACVSYSQAAVGDMGIPSVCESDIHGAISSIIMEAVALNSTPSFFADVTIRHPENSNGLLLWHDSFPASLRDQSVQPKLGTHWIIPDFPTGMCHWKLKDGVITIGRFDGERGQYSLFADRSKTIEGPFTQNTYVWVEVGDFKKLERKLIEGPYIHHTSCIYGDYVDALQEACKYISHLTFDPVQ